MNPNELVFYGQSEEPDDICKKIYSQFSNQRIPQSDYFRLSESQLNQCRTLIKDKDNKIYSGGLFKGIRFFLVLFSVWVGISLSIIKFGIEPVLKSFS